MVNKNIEHKRGDTLAFDVKLRDIENVTVTSLQFCCKRSESDAGYVFNKTIGDGVTEIEPLHYRVRVPPDDTANRDPGCYCYFLRIGLGSDAYTILTGHLGLR